MPDDEMIAEVERLVVVASRASRSHYLFSKRLQAMHTYLGLPVVILSASAGTAAFSSLGSDPSTSWRALSGVVSIVVAALAAVQTFFRYAERAEQHRAAGARLAGMARRLRVLQLRVGQVAGDDPSLLADLASFTSEFNSLEEANPDVPDRFYDAAVGEKVAGSKATE